MMKKGSVGNAVRRLQAMIGAPVTGKFDPRTDGVVRALQRRLRLASDGIVGPKSWPRFAEEAARAKRDARIWPRVDVVKVDLPDSPRLAELVDDGRSYGHFRLRSTTAKRLEAALAELEGSGVVLTSSGGMRSLRADVGANRSATSFHYSGRAFDLGIYTGATPGKDPLLVVRDSTLVARRRFRVFARASNLDHPLVMVRRVKALDLAGRRFTLVNTAMVDITALFEKHGLMGIGARAKAWADPFAEGHYGGLEWWHFQDEEGLEEGMSTFGDSLLEIHGFERAKSSPAWAHAGEFFGEGWQ